MRYDTDENGTRWGVKPRNLVPTGWLGRPSSWASALNLQAVHQADVSAAEYLGARDAQAVRS